MTRDEFESLIGETQRPGDKDALGLPQQLPADIPIGPAPPHIRHVISTYDARPIGGYDFLLSDQSDFYVDAQRLDVVTPLGYMSILRRIEIEASPTIIQPGLFSWLLQIGGITLPNWRWLHGPTLNERSINLFVVVPPETQITLLYNGATITQNSIVIGRFIGNLILDVNAPPDQHVGSTPPSVIPLTERAGGFPHV